MDDSGFMEIALEEAKSALAEGEIPVGAVIVKDGDVITRDHNRRERLSDPTAHAEILAIRTAAMSLGDWRLEGCTLFVTKEPCPMCAGAICLARMEEVVFGAFDPDGGAGGTVYNLLEDSSLNHSVRVRGGIRGEEAEELLKEFFQGLR